MHIQSPLQPREIDKARHEFFDTVNVLSGKSGKASSSITKLISEGVLIRAKNRESLTTSKIKLDYIRINSYVSRNRICFISVCEHSFNLSN